MTLTHFQQMPVPWLVFGIPFASISGMALESAGEDVITRFDNAGEASTMQA